MAHSSAACLPSMKGADEVSPREEADSDKPTTEDSPLSAANMATMLINNHNTNIWMGSMLATAMKMMGRMGEVFQEMELESPAVQQLLLGREFSAEIERSVQSLIERGYVDPGSFNVLNQRAQILNRIAEDAKEARIGRRNEEQNKKQNLKTGKRQNNAPNEEQGLDETSGGPSRVENESTNNLVFVEQEQPSTSTDYQQNLIQTGTDEQQNLILLGSEGDACVRYYNFEAARGYVVDTSGVNGIMGGVNGIIGTLIAYPFHGIDGSFICIAAQGVDLTLPADYITLAKAKLYENVKSSTAKRSALKRGESMGDVFCGILEKFMATVPRPWHLPEWPMEKFGINCTVPVSDVIESREPLLRALIRFYYSLAPLEGLSNMQAITSIKRAVEIVDSARLRWTVPQYTKRAPKRKNESPENSTNDGKKK